MAPTNNNNNNNQNNQADVSAIVARIDLLIETINKKFDDVRGEMLSAMDRYVLQAVHELEMKRLDEKDAEQQKQLNALEERVMGTTQRYLVNVAAVIGGLGGLIGILHIFHVL